MKMQIGDKIVDVDSFIEKDGKKIPVIKATTEEIRHPDGRVDVIVHVPCLKIQPQMNLN